MGPAVLSICTQCAPPGKRDARANGKALHERVREVRDQRGLKDVFKVEAVDCLGWCDGACVVTLSGKKKKTRTRMRIDAISDVTALVDMACAYAALPPGGELEERQLRGKPAG